ncbi:MAG: Gfo/Idh/MocA family oxidoreductase [bacterium]
MFKLAVIGLDTSHSVKFTELIQGKNTKIKELKVVKCMRFPSAFQSEGDQDKRQKELGEYAVKVTKSFSEAVEGVNGILLEINDPALHLEYFQKVAELNLPVFLDKPMADNLKNAVEICRIAKERNINVWTSSSLRFTPEIRECVANIDSPVIASVYGPLGKAAKGSSLIWYGIHSFEMLMTLMGKGVKNVTAIEDEKGVVSIVNYKDGRRGIVECNDGASKYGGRAQSDHAVQSFEVNFADAGELYNNLITAIRDFFIDGTVPIKLEDSLEIQSMMEAAAESLKSGKTKNVQN